ncbi:MAG: YceI family protein [Fidelibacterota bacterium]|jgi:polyisoprenoid-binding protein YceI|tara:strand:+ start:911 stop:1555 length:645 start_codon:yes stop_codon:yes gene_type:complete
MKSKFLLFTAITTFMMVSISCDKAKKNIPENMIGDINIFDKDSYVINSVDSKIMWKGKELSTKEHFGTMDISNGNISINKNGDINGIIDINMETIDTKDLEGQWKEKLNGHLKSPDFFDVLKYPIAILKFKGNKNSTIDGMYKFKGDLTIKGITHPISFLSKIKNENKILIAQSKIAFDRSLYNVRYGSGKFFDNLGDKLIFDEIKVEVLLETK